MKKKKRATPTFRSPKAATAKCGIKYLYVTQDESRFFSLEKSATFALCYIMYYFTHRISEIVFTYQISEIPHSFNISEIDRTCRISEYSLMCSGRLFIFQINEYWDVISEFSLV